MAKRRNLMAAVLAVLALPFTSCGDDLGYTYSDYRCNLIIDNAVHNNATLGSAMNSMSTGTFCTISFKNVGGAYYYVFSSNLGETTQSIFNDIDKQRSNNLRLGLNYGVIVGFGNLSSPAEFYAYDAECPNCFDADALPLRSYKLTVSGAGIATCANCKHTYNLNTGGNCTNASGQMNRYRASTTGPFGTLYVN